MRGRVVTAGDFETNRMRRLIKLTPTVHGESRLLSKIKAAGVKHLDIRFASDETAITLVIPEQVEMIPDSVGRGPRARNK